MKDGYHGSLKSSYKKYSVRRPVAAGTARWLSGTAEKMVKRGFKSSPKFMIDATLPQR